MISKVKVGSVLVPNPGPKSNSESLGRTGFTSPLSVSDDSLVSSALWKVGEESMMADFDIG
jgi:hypothetical protein